MRSASQSKGRRRGSRGFTLVEAIISLTLLIIVMVVTMSMLFTMRSFAERQQYHTAPRQSARRAMEYLGTFAESATDMNWMKNNPNAIPTQVRLGANITVPINVTYNNLVGNEYSVAPYNLDGVNMGGGTTMNGNALIGASGRYSLYGDVGTDLLTISQPVNDLRVPIAQWTGNLFASATMRIDFEDGCPDDDLNLELFKAQVGYDPGTGTSAVIGYIDGNGNWYYYQITNFPPQGSVCNNSPTFHTQGPTPTCTPRDPTNPCDVIHVVANFGLSDGINPPGGFRPPIRRPLSLALGSRIYAFRVRTPTSAAGEACGPPALEQKIGYFYPPRDACPGSGTVGTAGCGACANSTFTPIVEGIEDMQIAWLYAADPADPTNGTALFRGTATQSIPATLPNPDAEDAITNANIPTFGVPPQSGQISVDNTNDLCAEYPLDQRALVTAGAPEACRYDIRYVRGMRLTFTGRSLAVPIGASQLRLRGSGTVATAFRPDYNYRPAAENNAAVSTTPDGFEHYKMTTTLLVRNRMLGN